MLDILKSTKPEDLVKRLHTAERELDAQRQTLAADLAGAEANLGSDYLAAHLAGSGDASRSAEWVTREAMQIHGGMGYAEEFDVSRYFVDARVLSIFEGADETLCLKVIIRRLVAARG